MKQWMLVGILFIFFGVALFGYYDSFVKPDREAKELLVEGKMSYERGSKDAINKAIEIFTKVIARYPGTDSSLDSYYYIAQSYEKLNLNRLAYLKYIYILKNNEDIPGDMRQEIKARIARLKILKRYDEEGIHHLLTALNFSEDRDFRSRVYTELGHTYLKNGQLNKSRRMFDLALTENGSNEEAILGKARAYKRMGRDTQAYDLYDYFLKYYANFSYYTDDINKSYMRQLYESGLNSYRKGRYYPAITFFRRYLKKFSYSNRSENALYWIGESYFSLKNYSKAAGYFKRVRSNSIYHKDQDAFIKTGYSYFLAKNYDLAAREFQSYLDTYPNGKHISKAREWKNMSTKELLYKYRKNSPQDEILEENSSEDESENKESSSRYREERSRTVQTGVDVNQESPVDRKEDFYENVAEI